MKNNTVFVFFAVILIMLVLLGASFAYGKNTIEDTEDTVSSFDEKNVYNFLLLGRDTAAGLCDVVILASVNVKDGNVNIMQIPRDTYFNCSNASYKKINGAANTIGTCEFSEQLAKALGIDIDYYMSLSTKDVEQMVDMLSFVEIDVPDDLDYEDPSQNLSIHIKRGKQRLNGAEAVKFLRYRSGYVTGDIGRIDAQKLFLNSFVKRVGEQKNPMTVYGILKLACSRGQTNIREQDMITLGMKCAKLSGGSVYYMTAPGEAVQSEKSGAWYYIISKKSMQEIIEVRFDGSCEKADFDKFVDNEVKSFYYIYNKRCEYKIFTANDIENNQININ